MASLAGDHSRVSTSSTSEARTRPMRLCTNGRQTITAARPRSQPIITRLRSHRSTSTPASGPKKNPGTIARRHDQADGSGTGAGFPAPDACGQQDDGREPQPVTRGRDHLHEPQPEERVRAEQPHVPPGPLLAGSVADGARHPTRVHLLRLLAGPVARLLDRSARRRAVRRRGAVLVTAVTEVERSVVELRLAVELEGADHPEDLARRPPPLGIVFPVSLRAQHGHGARR